MSLLVLLFFDDLCQVLDVHKAAHLVVVEDVEDLDIDSNALIFAAELVVWVRRRD